MNHVELRISQNQIDVYATDAGVAASSATLKHIAVITNANLTLTRGLIWLEDVHYNADKGDASRPSQREHTFSWDNVAFDGPFTYRDFSYDALDNNAPDLSNSTVDLGKHAVAGQSSQAGALLRHTRPTQAPRDARSLQLPQCPQPFAIDAPGHRQRERCTPCRGHTRTRWVYLAHIRGDDPHALISLPEPTS